MIFFDITKTGPAGHRSGLTRVSARLREELGSAATPVRWPAWKGEASVQDWFLTSEVFSPDERPGFGEWLDRKNCRCAAIFHDAIPLKHPHITWPQSVARHPSYLKMLARFDRVWAVSEASRRELVEFWQWQGVEYLPEVHVLPLGADFDGRPRTMRSEPDAKTRLPLVLCVGIIEPRKNQEFLLDVAEALWRDGVEFELHLVGRVNPHFGPPIVARIKTLQRTQPGLHFHEAASDAEVAGLYAKARLAVFPTIAEGCGLPLLEALWRGLPCVCSDLPVLRENADGGGCVSVASNDRAAWHAALRRLLTEENERAKLTAEAIGRPLPTWASAATVLREALGRV